MTAMTPEEKIYFEQLQEKQQASWPVSVPRQPHYPHGEIALTEYLRAWARQQPDATALIFYGCRISYAELNERSDQCAALLHEHGVRAGDRVAVILGNCPQFFFSFYGILKLGAVYVPVNPMFKEAELLHELSDAGARAAIVMDSYAPLLMSVGERLGLGTVFTTALGELLPVEPEIAIPRGLDAVGQPVPGTLAFLPALVRCKSRAPEHTVDLDAVAALNYTGGTTGLPKGCIHTQRDMIYTASASSTASGFISPNSTDDAAAEVMLNFIPLFWIAGENGGLIFPIFTGRTLVLLNRWDPLAMMQAIERYRVRHCFMLVDNALEIMEHPQVGEYDLRSLASTRVASFVRKLSIDYRRKWYDLTGATMVESSWGMTETHTSDTFTTGMQAGDQDLLGSPGFVGLPVSGTYIKICNFETGALCRPGVEGEIVVHTPSLFKGYWRRPEASAEVVREGWFHTGDIGMYDEKGFLHYLGRRKEMLKVRGMSVFPTEVEALVCLHPAVQEAAVVGRPDDSLGQVPVAFVRLRPGESIDASSLEAWCRNQMATYKVPEIRIVTQWPMTATGKIKKHELEIHAANKHSDP